MAERDTENLLDLPLRKAIARLAYPAAGTLFLRMLGHSVDQFWVGHLPDSVTALAAVGSASFVLWMVYSASSLFSTGLQATVARAVGAQDRQMHAEAVRHGAVHAVLTGCVVAACGILGERWILHFQDLSPEVQELAGRYLRLIFCGLPLNYLGLAYATCFRAEGDTLTPLKVLTIGPVASFVLDPILVYGWGPFPTLGVVGAATVNILVSTMQAVALRAVYRRRREHQPVRLQAAWLWRLTRIGLPMAASGVLFSAVYVWLVRVLSPYGDAPTAALTLGHTIEGYCHFLCVGYGTAAATLVGQNLGARRPDEAERAAYAVAAQLIVQVTPIALLVASASRFIVGLYVGWPHLTEADLEVVRFASLYLWVAAAAQPFMAYEVVMWNAQAGAGATVRPTIVDLVVFPARIPIAYLLARHLQLGPLGVWLAIGLTAAAGGLGQTLLVRSGYWREQQV